MLAIGVKVRVLPPFSDEFPAVYVIESQSPRGDWRIAGGIDFDPAYLEAV